MIIHIAMLWVNKSGSLQGTGPLACLVFGALLLAFSFADAEEGVALFQAGKFGEARSVFEETLKAHPNDPVALFYMGRLTSEAARSRGFFQSVIAKHPEHDLADDAHFELAEMDFAQGLYVTARRKLRALLASYPQTNLQGQVHYRVGLTFLAIHQPDSAMASFERVKTLPGVDLQTLGHARLGLLEAHLQKGQQHEALRDAKLWLSIGAGDLDADVRALIKKIAPDEVVALPDPKSPVGKFWIQVAAFKNIKSAVALQKQLQEKGLRVDLGTKTNSRWTFVFVGPYMDKGSALKDSKRIDQWVRVKSKVTER